VKQGKVRAIGASNYDGERLAQALEVGAKHGYQVSEPAAACNLYERAHESKLEPACREKGTA
jgi:aryl-alcohol dehydrogenase-like predicted oxidoreductase